MRNIFPDIFKLYNINCILKYIASVPRSNKLTYKINEGHVSGFAKKQKIITGEDTPVFTMNLTEFHCSPGNGARYVKWTAFILEH